VGNQNGSCVSRSQLQPYGLVTKISGPLPWGDPPLHGLLRKFFEGKNVVRASPKFQTACLQRKAWKSTRGSKAKRPQKLLKPSLSSKERFSGTLVKISQTSNPLENFLFSNLNMKPGAFHYCLWSCSFWESRECKADASKLNKGFRVKLKIIWSASCPTLWKVIQQVVWETLLLIWGNFVIW